MGKEDIEDRAAIGKRIKTLRVFLDMTQSELGARIGVTAATINKYEQGQVDFPRYRIERLAGVLGVTPGYLLGWDINQSIKYPANTSAPDTTTDAGVEIISSGGPSKPKTKSKGTPGDRSFTSASLDVISLMAGTESIKAQTHKPELASVNMQALSPEEHELLRLFKSFNVRKRHSLLQFAWDLENQPGDK